MSAAERYFGSWSNWDGLRSDWSDGYGENAKTPDDFPSDAEILFASYGGAAYEGDALVVFERGGKLFEANGSHCSCNGLEGTWSPEETTWEALKIRTLYDHDKEACDALAVLVASRLPQ